MLHSTELFAHLQQYRPVSVEAVLKGSSSVHPAVLALGLRYGDGSITGSTARCVAMVHALCQVSVLNAAQMATQTWICEARLLLQSSICWGVHS